MKVKLISSILVLYSSVLFGCATTSDIKPYTVQPQLSASLQERVVFSLPRTILEVKITYSLYDKKVWPADAHGNPINKDKDGKLLSPKTTARIVAIDKPIEVSTKTIPDQDMRFIFDSESLKGFAKDTDITIDLTNNGMLKGTNIDVKDKTKEIVLNLPHSPFL